MMTARALAAGVARRWYLALAPVLLVAALSVWSARQQPPPATIYAATMRFVAGLPPERPEADYDFARHYAWLASEYTAQSFTSVVQGTEFAAAVADRMVKAGGSATRDQVAAAIQVNPPDSFKLVVRAQWPDSAGALALAQAISDELVQNGNAYWPQLSGNTLPPVQRLDTPVIVPVVLATSRNPLELPIRLTLALGAGLALALAFAAGDPVTRAATGGNITGLPVLAVIPAPERGALPRSGRV